MVHLVRNLLYGYVSLTLPAAVWMFSFASSPSINPFDVFNVFLFASIFLLMVLTTAVRLTPCLLVISDGLMDDLIPQIILPDLYETFAFRYTLDCILLIDASHLIHYFLSSVSTLKLERICNGLSFLCCVQSLILVLLSVVYSVLFSLFYFLCIGFALFRTGFGFWFQYTLYMQVCNTFAFLTNLLSAVIALLCTELLCCA